MKNVLNILTSFMYSVVVLPIGWSYKSWVDFCLELWSLADVVVFIVVSDTFEKLPGE